MTATDTAPETPEEWVTRLLTEQGLKPDPEPSAECVAILAGLLYRGSHANN